MSIVENEMTKTVPAEERRAGADEALGHPARRQRQRRAGLDLADEGRLDRVRWRRGDAALVRRGERRRVGDT